VLRKRKEKLAVDDLIKIGSEIAGSAAGATIGFFTAGPAGAALGGATGPLLAYTFSRLGAEMRRRQLGPREELRIGATIAFAAEKIKQKLANGEQIRQDGFFQKQPNERTAADEILEGILLVAQREHQERKLPFYGNLIANIAFHPEIDRAQANLLIRLAERISYRQICLLALFGSPAKQDFGLRQEDYSKAGNIGAARVGLLQEIYDLYSQGMLNASGVALIDLPGVVPGKMNVQGTGAMLYNLMELSRIDLMEHDITEIVSLLL
jgi:hypothetical protein